MWKKIRDVDTSLTSWEDFDFTWRADLLGVSMSMAPDALLHFRLPMEAGSSFRKARSYGRAHVQLFLRYQSLGQRRIALAVELSHVKQTLMEIFRWGDQ
jgi:GT2 family glycosyltransferase